MHDRVQNLLARTKLKYHSAFYDGTVLEIGSLDVNGTPRGYFDDCFYIGLDCVEGKGVDLIEYGHRLTFREGFFDTIISTEALEHDRYWRMTISNACRMLKPGGMLILTMATLIRPPHEMKSPFCGYYSNLDKADVEMLIGGCGYNMELLESEICGGCDLYIIARKGTC